MVRPWIGIEFAGGVKLMLVGADVPRLQLGPLWLAKSTGSRTNIDYQLIDV